MASITSSGPSPIAKLQAILEETQKIAADSSEALEKWDELIEAVKEIP